MNKGQLKDIEVDKDKLVPDKKREKGRPYKKKDRHIYDVFVDMFEYPPIKMPDGGGLDVWKGTANEIGKQLKEILSKGGIHFNDRPSKIGDNWFILHRKGDHKYLIIEPKKCASFNKKCASFNCASPVRVASNWMKRVIKDMENE